MGNLLLFPLKLLGWTAAGLALGVGWKLGCNLVDVAMGEKTLMCFPQEEQSAKPQQEAS
ncbi:MAG TPA: hypothetical protein VK463_15640 [Desulfomonilaceae bacterium]|nr:hypothetical protein [Desulfomonilaceae bacterium]